MASICDISGGVACVISICINSGVAYRAALGGHMRANNRRGANRNARAFAKPSIAAWRHHGGEKKKRSNRNIMALA